MATSKVYLHGNIKSLPTWKYQKFTYTVTCQQKFTCGPRLGQGLTKPSNVKQRSGVGGDGTGNNGNVAAQDESVTGADLVVSSHGCEQRTM